MQSMNKMADESHVTLSAADNHNSFVPLQSQDRDAAAGETGFVLRPSITGKRTTREDGKDAFTSYFLTL